jgi:hypothetical protein
MVPARLAATFLDLAGDEGEEISGVTHQDLGGARGNAPGDRDPHPQRFRVQDLVELERLRIRIIDPAGLRAVIDT